MKYKTTDTNTIRSHFTEFSTVIFYSTPTRHKLDMMHSINGLERRKDILIIETNEVISLYDLLQKGKK